MFSDRLVRLCRAAYLKQSDPWIVLDCLEEEGFGHLSERHSGCILPGDEHNIYSFRGCFVVTAILAHDLQFFEMLATLPHDTIMTMPNVGMYAVKQATEVMDEYSQAVYGMDVRQYDKYCRDHDGEIPPVIQTKEETLC